MENVASNLSGNKPDMLLQIEAAIANLHAPEAASVQKALSSILTADTAGLDSLLSFTGYYGLDNAENAFLSIDTSEIYINIPVAQQSAISFKIPTVTINVSLDGKTAASYPFDGNASFDGKTLTIKDVLTVTLTREYKDGALATLSGTISPVGGTSTSINASTYFNPVSLPVFAGDYKEITKGNIILSVADSSIRFDFGSGLENVEIFSYNPSMYVLRFLHGSGKDSTTYTLMLGTSGSQGLACFITDGTQNDFAVTLQ